MSSIENVFFLLFGNSAISPLFVCLYFGYYRCGVYRQHQNRRVVDDSITAVYVLECVCVAAVLFLFLYN